MVSDVALLFIMSFCSLKMIVFVRAAWMAGQVVPVPVATKLYENDAYMIHFQTYGC
jgi:hypothetical protein